MTRLASLVVSFSVLGMASCAWSAEGLPSRSDCLVRVDFPKGFQDDQEVDGLAIASELGVPLAAYGARRGALFLQFEEACEQRRAFTMKWMEAYMARSSWPMEWVVSDERIAPGRDTIDVRGEAWRD